LHCDNIPEKEELMQFKSLEVASVEILERNSVEDPPKAYFHISLHLLKLTLGR
jgi:hypothetical protein